MTSFVLIGNAEEHATLSRALSQLAEVEEKIEQLHVEQVESLIELHEVMLTLNTCYSVSLIALTVHV